MRGSAQVFSAIFFFAFSFLNQLQAVESYRRNIALDQWLQSQKNIAREKLLKNISAEGTSPGSVIASPSKSEPDYFRHWIRDAGLTMNLVISFYENASTPEEKNHFFQRMMDYIDFSRLNQTTPNPSGGLGEPLFLVNGEPFNQGWGRPQNDSPAIRAMVLTRWAHVLLNEGKEDLVRQKLYDNKIPAYTVIKADLEYTSHHWADRCFDLWEEVKGHHFYTRMVQRRALVDGAKLATRLGDGGAASWYQEQAELLSREIQNHWSSDRKLIQTTLNYEAGAHYKNSNLDASSILAIMHADTHDGFFPVYDDRALVTANKLIETFRSLYPINQHGPGVAIGRYPEDVYNGTGTSEGSPWILLTAGFGEYHYRVAKGFKAKGEITINDVNIDFFRGLLPGNSQIKLGKINRGEALFGEIIRALANRGDSFMERTKLHTANDGSMSEQMNRHNGFLQGARDLTWSYAGFLVAAWER